MSLVVNNASTSRVTFLLCAGKKEFFQTFISLHFFFLSPPRCASMSINNADDKNEECMEIEVLYTSTGAGGGEGGAPPV